MKRRHFVAGAAVALVMARWPAWLKRAFGDVSVKEPRRAGESPNAGAGGLDGRLRAARASGKPLLVLVIPEKDAEKWERGRVYGQLLNYGDAAQLAPLALVDVACARMAELGPWQLAKPSGEPLLVLIDPAGAAMFDTELPTLKRRKGSDNWQENEAEESRLARATIAKLAALVRTAVLPSGMRSLELRAGEARAALPASEAVEVERRLAMGEALPGPYVDRAAAMVMLAAERVGGGRRDRLLALLEASVIARLRKKAPPGSHWAQSGGCGLTIEDDSVDDGLSVSCGMGHVPAMSQRFLYLYARTPSEERRRMREQEEKAKGSKG